MKDKLKKQKQNSQLCNSKICFPVFEQVIISTEKLEIKQGNILETGNIAIEKQTLSGLFHFKTKFNSKMTGDKKSPNNRKNM